MRYAIGIDIGGTKMRAARVSADGVMFAHRVMPTPKTSDAVMAQIDALIPELVESGVAAIGIGVPGRVDASKGKVLSGGFVDLSGMPLAERLTKPGSRGVFIDNDANMALVAESRIGAAKGLAHAILLTIGTGIGGAIMDSGRIIHGGATAGQLGHVTVDANGAACACGGRGCVETTSSGTALRRHIAAAGLEPTTSIAELLRREDSAAKSIIAAWAGPLRAAIDGLVAALDPEVVILGGGLGAAACAALADFPARSPWYQCQVAPARLGDDAGVIGAALAALEHAA